MRQIRSQRLPFERMTREPGHHFFGYYDLQPWSGDGRCHLCHRVDFMDRMQAAADGAELGVIRAGDYRFMPFASTHAWNFQQGAMLQWNPRRPDEEVFYNAYFSGAFRAVAHDVATGERRLLPRPLANVSQDGTHALSINFSRLLAFRPGYGYDGVPDPFVGVPAPADDGIFLIDLATGSEKLILPLAAIAESFARKFRCDPARTKLLVNHITFNPSGDRFVFLVRNMPLPGEKSAGWATLFATADLSGSDVHVFDNFGGASHYIWRDDEHLLIYADLPGPGKMALCLARDRTQTFEVLDPAFFAFDGHCSYSPDKRHILYDSYPDADGYRRLLLYDTCANTGTLLADLLSVKRAFQPEEDIRCDLHPRWNRDGTAISFDSVHEGSRHVYAMSLDGLVG